MRSCHSSSTSCSIWVYPQITGSWVFLDGVQPCLSTISDDEISCPDYTVVWLLEFLRPSCVLIFIDRIEFRDYLFAHLSEGVQASQMPCTSCWSQCPNNWIERFWYGFQPPGFHIRLYLSWYPDSCILRPIREVHISRLPIAPAGGCCPAYSVIGIGYVVWPLCIIDTMETIHFSVYFTIR